MCVPWKLHQVEGYNFKIGKFEAYYGSLNSQATKDNIPEYIELTFKNESTSKSKTRYFKTKERNGGDPGIIFITPDTFPGITDGKDISPLVPAGKTRFYLHKLRRDREQFINLLSFFFGLGVIIDLSFELGKVAPLVPYFGAGVVFIIKLFAGIFKAIGLLLILIKGLIVEK